MKCTLSFLLFWSLLLLHNAHAADLEALRVRYAWAVLPDASVYFDVLGTNAQRVSPPQVQQLTLTIGSSSATMKQVEPFEQTNEGVAYVLLVDISKSLKTEQFARVRTALKSWIQALIANDRVAIMTFGKEVKLIRDFTGDKESLQKAVDTLAPTDDLTQLHQGLLRALEMGKRADANLPRYRVIVTMSDGQDDFPGGVTAQEVLDRLKEDRIPIYTLGFTPSAPSGKEKEALKALGILARTSGGEYLEATGDRLEADYAALRQRIRQVFVARVSCPTCVADGQVQRLQLTQTVGTKTLTDGLSLRLLPRVVATAPPSAAPLVSVPPIPSEKIWWWPYAAGGGLLVLLAGVPFWLRSRKPVLPPGGEESAHDSPLPSTFVSPKAPSLRVRLTIVGNAAPTKTYDVNLADHAIIGRHPTECAVIIADDPEISARHCQLVREAEMVFVRDLESRNGTLVNGVPIVGRHKLSDDDLLSIGRTNLRFSLKG
jgi:Mg-chelatase subunit ChlD